MKTKLKSYGYFLGVAITGIAIGALLQSAKAVWTEPTVAPTGTSIIGAPINTSATSQIKSGLLTTGAFSTTNMCIGGVCKTAWPTATGDNLGNHTATQALNMNGNAITGVSGVTVNVGGVNFALKYANATEDVYGSYANCGDATWFCPKDTCNGNSTIAYECGPSENKTCLDITDGIFNGICGDNNSCSFPGSRTVTCKRALVLTE